MTTLYLIRHCETVANETHLLQGSRDYPLSERGVRQLDYLKERFEDTHIDKIYSSPQGRALKTAEAVRGGRDIEILTDGGLCEINCGVLEGKILSEHFKKDPELEYRWKNKPQLLDFEGGESAKGVYARAAKAVQRIAHSNTGKTVAVTSHGFAVRCVLAYFLYGDVDKLGDVELPGNTSVTKIEFSEDGRHRIVYLNDVSHLPDDLKTFFKAK